MTISWYEPIIYGVRRPVVPRGLINKPIGIFCTFGLLVTKHTQNAKMRQEFLIMFYELCLITNNALWEEHSIISYFMHLISFLNFYQFFFLKVCITHSKSEYFSAFLDQNCINFTTLTQHFFSHSLWSTQCMLGYNRLLLYHGSINITL